MSSAWGDSFGDAWADSWKLLVPAPVPTPTVPQIPLPGYGSGGSGPYILADKHKTVSAEELRHRRKWPKPIVVPLDTSAEELDVIVAAIYYEHIREYDDSVSAL